MASNRRRSRIEGQRKAKFNVTHGIKSAVKAEPVDIELGTAGTRTKKTTVKKSAKKETKPKKKK